MKNIKLSAPQIGKAGELRVASELMLRGLNPAMFFFDEGTDIVLSNGKKIGVKTSMKPIYCKSAYSWRYSFSMRVPQFRGGENGTYKKKLTRRNYDQHVDYWILWCVKNNFFYIIPRQEIGQRISFCIRTPNKLRTYKKHINKPSQSKYEKYKDNWEILR